MTDQVIADDRRVGSTLLRKFTVTVALAGPGALGLGVA